MARRRRRASENVRFTPESGHTAGCTKCPLSAKSGHCETKRPASVTDARILRGNSISWHSMRKGIGPLHSRAACLLARSNEAVISCRRLLAKFVLMGLDKFRHALETEVYAVRV